MPFLFYHLPGFYIICLVKLKRGKIMYNIEKIREELKPISIVSYFRISYKRSGKNIFILCPEHEERTGFIDRHIGNCVIGDSFKNAYYCFGCGAKGDAFRMIAMIEHLDPKKEFGKILDIAADICGGSELFTETCSARKKTLQNKQKNLNKCSLSKEQLDLIGLLPKKYPQIYCECITSEYIIEKDKYLKNLDSSNPDEDGLPLVTYLSTRPFNYSLSDLANDDYDLYVSIIKAKCEETMDKYKQLSQKDWLEFSCNLYDPSKEKSSLSSFCERLKSFYKTKYLEAEAIWKQFASLEELNSIDNSWIFEYDFEIEKKPGTVL